MKPLIFSLTFIFLMGCTKTTPTQAIIDHANTALAEVKESLPAECQTKDVFAKIDKVQALINTAPKTCELQIQSIRMERNSYALGFFSMIALALFVLLRRTVRL